MPPEKQQKSRGHSERFTLVLLHGGSLLATVAATALLPPTGLDFLLIFCGWLAAGLGISVGYHRMLAHRAFDASPLTELVLLSLGAMTGQGPPRYWAHLHRTHHRYSDEDGDPHSPMHGYTGSPLQGFVHAHFAWILQGRVPKRIEMPLDIDRNDRVRFVNRHHILLLFAGLLIPTTLGAGISGTVLGAVHGLFWGGFARIVVVNHIIWGVNSVCHFTGRTVYQTGDSSRNVWWFAVLSFGEGWHNNHHIAAASASFMHRWWQLDPGYVAIVIMRALGFASSVRLIRPSTLVSMRVT